MIVSLQEPATPSWLGRTIIIVRGAPKRPAAKPNYPRLAYHGPPIGVDSDAARAAAIIERIRNRCPELTRADLLLVARVLNDHQRVKDGPARSRKPRPASAARKTKAISQATQQPAE